MMRSKGSDSVVLTIQQIKEVENDIQDIWNKSIPFHQFWKSYFTFLLYPKKHMRVLNFAYKVIVEYKIDIKDRN